MGVEIRDFAVEHVDEAKELALFAYNQERSHVQILPAVDDLAGLAEFAANGLGVVAVEQGKMVGFLCCHHPRENAFRSQARGVFSPTHGHGAVRENRGPIYQRMYQAAAEKWVKQGIAYHGLALYAHDAEAIRAMFAYGFGLRCVDAIRPMEPIGGAKPQGIHFTELAPREQAKIRELRTKLMEHLGQSPCFMYFSPAEIKVQLAQLEAKDVRLFVATDGETPVAYAEVSPEGENFATEVADMLNITGAYCLNAYRGQDIYPALLDHLIMVLKREGYGRLGADFESFNPAAYAFWGKYFANYTNSLVRRIDECAL